MTQILILFFRRESEPTSDRYSSQDNSENRLYGEKQMTAVIQLLTGASPSRLIWDSIDWEAVKAQVFRLQMRIAKAVRAGRHGKVKALQWLLTHSFYAKLLAVKRVAQNRGGKTPGVDKVVWKTPQQKMKAVQSLQRRGYQPQPLKRVYIPKKRRPSKTARRPDNEVPRHANVTHAGAGTHCRSPSEQEQLWIPSQTFNG